MNGFTRREFGEKLSLETVSLKLDSKGRISIPSFLRKNFGLDNGSSVLLIFDLEKNSIELIPNLTACSENGVSREKSSPGCNGQNGVIGNTRDCGSLILGSNGFSLRELPLPQEIPGKEKRKPGNPSSGPEVNKKTIGGGKNDG